MLLRLLFASVAVVHAWCVCMLTVEAAIGLACTTLSLDVPLPSTTDLDCSLLGLCTDGACVCDPGFQGIDCGTPKLKPFTNSGFVNNSHSSWGGSTVQDTAGTYHLFFSEMLNDCPLCLFYNVSAFSHAVSDDPAGNFTWVETIRMPFAHNAQPVVTSTGEVAVFGIISEETAPPSEVASCVHGAPQCANGLSCGGLPKAVHAVAAPSLAPGQNWTFYDIGLSGPPELNVTSASNPHVVVLPNDTAIMTFRYKTSKHGEYIGVASASSWKGPFTWHSQPVVTPADGFGSNEDPTLWVDTRGNYHIVTHNHAKVAAGDCGAHFFSDDFYTWHGSMTPFYTVNVTTADGGLRTMMARQRPQVALDADGIPLTLWTGGSFDGTWREVNATQHTYVVEFDRS